MSKISKFFEHPFVADTAERAGKSAIQGFIVGSAMQVGSVAVDLRVLDWYGGLAVAGGMFLASIATSLLSYKGGTTGTASLSHSVEYTESPSKGEETSRLF